MFDFLNVALNCTAHMVFFYLNCPGNRTHIKCEGNYGSQLYTCHFKQYLTLQKLHDEDLKIPTLVDKKLLQVVSFTII